MTESNQTNPGQDVPQSETVPVYDLDTFVKYLAAWHQQKVDRVKHAMTVPDGGGITVEYEGADFLLEGDILRGFVIGLTYALAELGTLPFTAELEDTGDIPAANDDAKTA